jgi:hypothetical protein
VIVQPAQFPGRRPKRTCRSGFRWCSPESFMPVLRTGDLEIKRKPRLGPHAAVSAGRARLFGSEAKAPRNWWRGSTFGRSGFRVSCRREVIVGPLGAAVFADGAASVTRCAVQRKMEKPGHHVRLRHFCGAATGLEPGRLPIRPQTYASPVPHDEGRCVDSQALYSFVVRGVPNESRLTERMERSRMYRKGQLTERGFRRMKPSTPYTVRTYPQEAALCAAVRGRTPNG